MKVRVLIYAEWEDYCEKHGIEDPNPAHITDETFMAAYNELGEDWEFDSLADFTDEFNTDGPYAPTPSTHIIRFFN